jgi:flagellar export protein FliJ
MKRFRFRLERLERLRRTARSEARAELSAELARLSERRARRESAERSLVLAERGWHELLGPARAAAPRLREAAEALESARRALAGATSEERAARATVETAEERYAERRRDHRVLLRLRERRWLRFAQQTRRDEQKRLDELHVGRTPNRGAAGGDRDA